MFLLGTWVSSNCTADVDCKVVGNVICSPTGTCRCAHFASDTDTECIPGNINVTDIILQVMILKHLYQQNSGSPVEMTTSPTSKNPFVVKGNGVARKARLHQKIIANALMASNFN